MFFSLWGTKTRQSFSIQKERKKDFQCRMLNVMGSLRAITPFQSGFSLNRKLFNRHIFYVIVGIKRHKCQILWRNHFEVTEGVSRIFAAAPDWLVRSRPSLNRSSRFLFYHVPVSDGFGFRNLNKRRVSIIGGLSL